MSKKIVLLLTVVSLAVLCGLAEMALRFSGVIDFPIFREDAAAGYLPVPSQQGNFRNSRQWAINDLSMESAKWLPKDIYDLLLIGSSPVWGGTSLAQASKLGSQIEQNLSGWKVWSLSAENWTAANEAGYLGAHPKVLDETDVVVWVVDTRDLGAMSKWDAGKGLEQKRPASALAYSLGNTLFPASPIFNSRPAEIAPATEQLLGRQVASLRKQRSIQKILFVLFPAREEVKPASAASEAFYLRFRDRLRAAVGSDADILEVRDDPAWKTTLYRNDLQLTAVGNAVLANLIVNRLKLPPPDFR